MRSATPGVMRTSLGEVASRREVRYRKLWPVSPKLPFYGSVYGNVLPNRANGVDHVSLTWERRAMACRYETLPAMRDLDAP